jgi:hypothetical protein
MKGEYETMDIREYYRKSEIQRAREKVIDEILMQQGMNNMYYLGQITAIENLKDYIGKEIIIAFLKAITEGEGKDISETIKDLARKLIGKYGGE